MQGVEAARRTGRADLRLANLGGAYLEGAMMPPPKAQTRQPWPSEIAKAGRQGQTGKPPAKAKSNDTGNSM